MSDLISHSKYINKYGIAVQLSVGINPTQMHRCAPAVHPPQAHPGTSKVRVQCPVLEGNPNVTGQLLEVEVASLADAVGLFKERLADVLDVPASKQKLARDGVGFLKDEYSLAHYNVGPDVVLTLGTKERGGRKK